MGKIYMREQKWRDSDTTQKDMRMSMNTAM